MDYHQQISLPLSPPLSLCVFVCVCVCIVRANYCPFILEIYHRNSYESGMDIGQNDDNVHAGDPAATTLFLARQGSNKYPSLPTGSRHRYPAGLLLEGVRILLSRSPWVLASVLAQALALLAPLVLLLCALPSHLLRTLMRSHRLLGPPQFAVCRGEKLVRLSTQTQLLYRCKSAG